MNKQDYRRYLESAHWKKTKAAKLVLAGHRCEFAPIVGEHPKHGNLYGLRCFETRRLEVHHLSYVNLGQEKEEDLEVLCRFHHLVRHASGTACAYCGEWVETEEEDAIAAVRNAIIERDGDIDGITLEEIAPFNNICDYCDHKMTKDD